jgi:helicase MOV-10
LHIPNTLFYDGQLEACGAHAITHSLIESEVLVKKGFPIVFHGVIGKDEREGSSPSFFNVDEASLVREYCERLLKKNSSKSKSKSKRNKREEAKALGMFFFLIPRGAGLTL